MARQVHATSTVCRIIIKRLFRWALFQHGETFLSEVEMRPTVKVATTLDFDFAMRGKVGRFLLLPSLPLFEKLEFMKRHHHLSAKKTNTG